MFYKVDGIFYDKKKLKEFVNKYNISLILIFGSYAKGRARESSDLDIGIKFDKNIDMNLYSSILRELVEIFNREDIDVVVLNYTDPLLRFEIISSCKVLYQAYSGAYIDFYLYSVKSYDDVKKLRKLEENYLKKGIKNELQRCHPPQIDKSF
ncbi:MAG: DNA polymerase, beta domain protein region [Caldanaerobacter subterraneus]|jgi:predicted nucleotidyltransferase|uniref:type VII toxin-antitoxin system MntA family adenylyltransferase antitoxin n=1 Tax=Thermoanaerobacter sp. TaxID=1755 RepID=UPI0001B2749F|nr:MAG: DNA polymerase beta domain-containing protein [Thermoanaerobacter thermocopriae]KUK35600.1 MAG: DNA polymerase, beta domain protein region [Caldanaerobacter subterraneus]HAA63994.1 nucleotidyltransferase domain-containing protein [Thermoanaerobacter sp.]HAA80930.1 nucleotidyltransferase domain-containing protein [Thermoanaerobacter sp.]HCD09679.1 nucleotidyltransferase domain-containing protein [Thermoanaerobacter sp.]